MVPLILGAVLITVIAVYIMPITAILSKVYN